MLKSRSKGFTPVLKMFLPLLLIAGLLLSAAPLGNSLVAKADTQYPVWNASTAYPAGSMVTYEGAVWRSRWYNVNEPPADVAGNAWECIISRPPDPPEPPEIPEGYDASRVFFDDFNIYDTSSDQALLDFGYEVSDRTGGPGPGGCVWKKENVTFVADTDKPGNRLLRLTATTRGSGETTTQAELLAPRQFLYGTYAARIKFTNTPAYGPDGDQVVETFYTISPWTLQNSPDYGEMDFEYLPNGGWGKSSMTMWNTTWETASIRESTATTRDFEGWHTCVIQATSTEVKYYVDGSLLATHGGIYPPETDMFLSFNLWFIDGVWAGGNDQRAYVQDVDWVYYSKDEIMAPAQAECNVEYYRRNLVTRKDTVANPEAPAAPAPGNISVDRANNAGSYTVTVTVPASNTADTLALVETVNGVYTVSATRAISPNSPSGQIFTFPMSGKAAGRYTYKAELTNSAGKASSESITVTVVSDAPEVPVQNYLFDDFSYTSSNDPALRDMKWVLREGGGGPGPSGCTWSASNVSFINDPSTPGNRVMRMSASTGGYGYNTSQSEVYQRERRFFEGTYAARVRFTDTPVSGPDGDQIVETFFAISPLNGNNDPYYSELDFEYLANGGWGVDGPTMWETSWYTYTPEPWSQDNVYDYQNRSHEGWHDLVFVVDGGEVRYYIDGELKATHTGKYYPRQNMSINFNLWFINTGLLGASGTRTYVQDVDWVYHAKDVALTPGQVLAKVDAFRAASVKSADTIDEAGGPTLKAADVSVDNATNYGNYTVTVTVPANNTATAVRLYEDSAVVLDRPLTVNSSSVQTFTYTTNKPQGTYQYRADVNDAGGTLRSPVLSVTVVPSGGTAPETAAVVTAGAVNHAAGSYDLTVRIPAGTMATNMKLYEIAGGSETIVLDRAVTPDFPSEQTFTYSAEGKPTGTYTYRADLSNAYGVKTGASINVAVSRTGTSDNVAFGKAVTSSIGPLANGAVVTDGDKTSYYLAGVGEGLQWIQLDLGQSYDINKINMWHYYDDGRTYYDVIVRVSNSADFSSGATTVYNNDRDNSAGFGAGTDTEYAERGEGKTVVFNAVNARYVRLYINGNSVNPYNHFVEVEVWTA